MTTPIKLRFACSACSATADVPFAYAGRQAKCRACKAVVRIPGRSTPRPVAVGAVDEDPFADAPPTVRAAMARLRQLAEGLGGDGSTADALLSDDEPGELELLPLDSEGSDDPASAPSRRRVGASSSRRGRVGASSSRRGRVGAASSRRGRVGASSSRRGRVGASSSRRGRVGRSPSRVADGERDLAGESHVRAFSAWLTLVSLLLLGVVALAALGAGAAGQAEAGGALLVLVVPIFGTSLILGWGLWRFRGWARWGGAVALVLFLLLAWGRLLTKASGLALAGGLIPTVYYGGLLHVLITRGHLFTPGYRRVVQRARRSAPFWTSPFFWIPLVMLGLTFVVAAAGR